MLKTWVLCILFGALLFSALTTKMTTETYSTLRVTRPYEHIVRVELNRPEKRNAMNHVFWGEIRTCFEKLDQDVDCRVVVLTGAGKAFSSGLDLIDANQPGQVFSLSTDTSLDTGKKSFNLREMLKIGQQSITAIEQCTKPVIAAIHGACVGGGVDMTSACDIRYCSQDAWFQIKETDIGVAADLGTLQRFPKIICNGSTARELALTARPFYAEEAKTIGFVSQVFKDRDACIEAAMDTAQLMASKAPTGSKGTKLSMVYSRDHTVSEGLDHVALWNIILSESLIDKSAFSGAGLKTGKSSKL